jgi:hypothetical protein
MKIAFLGHDQPIGGFVRPKGGYLAKDDADRLVQDLAAERISRKVIRAFAPGSALRILKSPGRCRIIGDKLPPREIENVKFIAPKTNHSTGVRSRYMPRFREVYGENQLAISLLIDGAVALNA